MPDNVKIHLIAHSIGSWMVLELLKLPDVQTKVQHSYLLFPTIERMRETFPGHILTRAILPYWSFLRMFIMLFNTFPETIATFLVSIFFSLVSIKHLYVRPTLQYLRLSMLDQILFLANEKMTRVRDVDVATITANRDRLKLYYGATDGWTPAEYVEQLRERVPGVDAEMDIYGVRHAFVLRKSVEMGRMVAGWIAGRRL